MTPETILVGHSCGGGFLVRWLSEHKDINVAKVVLVAPSLGKDWVEDEFFDFEIDPDLAKRTKGLIIFNSTDDKPAIQEATKIFRSTIVNVNYREFTGYGHFTTVKMKTAKFPELLSEVLA